MTVIKQARRRKKAYSLGLFYAALVVLVFLLSILAMLGPASFLHAVRNNSVKHHPPMLVTKMVEVRTLVQEAFVHKTIRDCLPSKDPKKCKTFVPDPIEGLEKVQRVALISPPGNLAMAVHNHMGIVAAQLNNRHTNNDGSNRETKIEVIQTTHVPPYGYGKSHGLTKIVKIMPQPILLQVVDALQGSLGMDHRLEDITIDDLRVGLLQIMRFHCRLSHVAAHTATLIIDRTTLLNATQLGLTLTEFMAPADKDYHAGSAGSADATTDTADDDEFRVFYQTESVGASIMTRLSEKLTASTTDLFTLLESVIKSEMERTKDMSVWPCPSFWDAPEPLQLSPINEELARSLSPDCSDPYVKCFVNKDKCEAAKDPICHK